MGDVDVLTVTLALAGMVILWGAIKNKNPLEVFRLTLQGKDPNSASVLASDTGGPLTQVIPGTASGDPSEFHTDGTPRAYPDGSPRYVGDPLPSQLPKGDPRLSFKSIPAPGLAGDPRAAKDQHRVTNYIKPLTNGGAFT